MERAWQTVSFWLPDVLEYVGTALNTFGRLLLPVLEYVGTFLWLIGHILQKPTVRKYYDTSVIAEAGRDAATWLIAILYSTLELGPTDRINLYVPEEQPKRFTRVARWSDNEAYRTSPGRPTYPMGQGVIGKAWNEGECIVRGSEVPDPQKDREAYAIYMEEAWSIPREQARRFIMPSRSYYAITLRAGFIPYAVLVVESTQKELPYDRIREIVNSTAWQRAFLSLREKLPHISYALKRGI